LYQGHVSSYVGLLNGYWDLFHMRGFTPYIGAGVGFAHHRTSDFTTLSAATFTDAATGTQAVQLSSGTARPGRQTDLAWALMAGTSYDLGPTGKLDLGYRYLDMGSGVALGTGLLDCSCGAIGRALKASDLTSHELRIGVRWMLGHSEPLASLK
jgi:opacity protein-like surface antigen